MRLTFSGAAHEVTGSCHFLEACGRKIFIDYGMEQGEDIFENQPVSAAAAENKLTRRKQDGQRI